MLFKKPIQLTHTHEVKVDNLKEVVDHAIDRTASLLKTVGITLLIGIPAVVVFALVARVGAEVTLDHMTASE